VGAKLEYGSNVWSPYAINYCKLIEDVQRWATKFIPNYPPNMNYSEKIKK
jgi:hypothetical protein